MCYPTDRLQEEIAFLGYYLHWNYDELLQMEHKERHQWLQQVSNINRKLNDGNETPTPGRSIMSIT